VTPLASKDASGPRMGAEQFLTAWTVARWIGVSRRTVCMWAEQGRIPAYKFGRQWRFRSSAIAAWISDRETTSLNDGVEMFGPL
jgi:excisionase family DNA binding protein